MFMRSALLLAVVVAAAVSATPELPLNVASGLFHFTGEPEVLKQSAGSGPVSRSVVLNSIEQRVDNFDPQNTDTYLQRYYMNGEFFQPGGPLLVVLGGEWAIRPDRLQDSMPVTLARELFGYIFYLEHRYYGQSFPTP